ncbi:MAG TPA: hypothetical protein VN802_16220 [Stellaceae bacterium]|nr:hypothetical protein [Stellaceae bacterium]
MVAWVRLWRQSENGIVRMMINESETVELARRMIERYGAEAHNLAVKWVQQAHSSNDARTADKWHSVLLEINALRNCAVAQ